MTTILLQESSSLLEDLAGPGLVVGYIVFIIAVVASIGLPIINAIRDPKGLIKALAGIVGLVVLFGISYALSGSEVTQRAASLGIDAASSRMIGAGMILFYIVLLVSAALAIFSLIKDIVSD